MSEADAFRTKAFDPTTTRDLALVSFGIYAGMKMAKEKPAMKLNAQCYDLAVHFTSRLKPEVHVDDMDRTEFAEKIQEFCDGYVREVLLGEESD